MPRLDRFRNSSTKAVAADFGGLSWRSSPRGDIHHVAGNAAEWLQLEPGSKTGTLAGGSFHDSSEDQRRFASGRFRTAELTAALPGFGFRMVLRPRDFLAGEFAGR